MPALPYPKYGLDSLYLFPYYQTRDAYRKAAGEEPPPWDPRKPPKYWMDAKARLSGRRNVVYDFTLAISQSGTPLAGPDGKPMLDLLVLPKEDAATVNIPPDATNVPGTDVPPVPPPLRPLEPNEELFFDVGGVVAVKNLDHPYWKETAGFTQADRALLRAIAAKLGVTGA